jgi:hypothetical protein
MIVRSPVVHECIRTASPLEEGTMNVGTPDRFMTAAACSSRAPESIISP